MRYVAGMDERGQHINVQDLAASVLDWARTARPSADRLAPALFSLRRVFGELCEDPRFQRAVTTALCRLDEFGARRAVLP